MLEQVVNGTYNIHIPGNRLHMHMLPERLAIEEEKEET